ncbi:MAG TPA: MotA/TolQ/ExbB proton channel family protein, partial [Rubricoccaceae bacterium]
MKNNSTFFTIVILAAAAISFVIYEFLLPEYIKEGGWLVAVLIALTLMVVTFTVERLLSLRKAAGRVAAVPFMRDLQARLANNDIDGAIEASKKQQGTLGSVLGAGLRRFQSLSREGIVDRKDTEEEIRAAIEEATMLEVPLLEKNLVALSTIASIATMVGLLGTTLGMIRAFAALASSTGAPDAVQLSLGISEALINTAGGLIAAIIGIVAYNYFTTK